MVGAYAYTSPGAGVVFSFSSPFCLVCSIWPAVLVVLVVVLVLAVVGGGWWVLAVGVAVHAAATVILSGTRSCADRRRDTDGSLEKASDTFARAQGCVLPIARGRMTMPKRSSESLGLG